MCVFICISHECSTGGGQKMTTENLDLELQMLVSFLGAENLDPLQE